MNQKLILLMGVSGAGKRTVAENLLLSDDLVTVNTTTTRPMRPGEVQGDKYNYVSDEEFQGYIAADDFIEYALVHKMYLYGTRKSLVQDVFDQGKSVIKEMEINGWTSVVEKPEVKEYCYSIFMDIPDEEMVRRILERNPETPHIEIENRLESAQIEREQALMLCDYYVDVFEMSREEQASYVKKVVDYLVNKTD